MPPWILRAVVGVSAVSLGGCYLHYNGMQTPTPTLHGRRAVAYAIPVPARGGIGVLYIPIEDDDPPAERIVPQRGQASQPAGPPPELPRVRLFDTVGATAALNGVDLAPCRAARAKRGYAHARVTFDTDGRVSDVFVDEPIQWPRNVVACVSDRLATARVREFDGAPVSVGTWLFIDFE